MRHVPGALELHHVRPVAAGGKAWDPMNCQAVCRQCHIRKDSLGQPAEEVPNGAKMGGSCR